MGPDGALTPLRHAPVDFAKYGGVWTPCAGRYYWHWARATHAACGTWHLASALRWMPASCNAHEPC